MSHTKIKMYGTAWCSDCKRTKKFFGEQRVHYDFIDIDGDAEGLAVVEKANNGKHIIPVLVFEDGSDLIEHNVTNLVLEPARHSEWIRVASRGKRGHNEGLDVLVQLIGRHDNTGSCLPDLTATCGIETNQVYVASTYRCRYHFQST